MRYNQKKGYARQRDQQTFDDYLKSEKSKWINHIRSKWAEDLKYEDWTLEALMRRFGGYYSRRVISQRYIRMAIAAGKYKCD